MDGIELDRYFYAALVVVFQNRLPAGQVSRSHAVAAAGVDILLCLVTVEPCAVSLCLFVVVNDDLHVQVVVVLDSCVSISR